MALLVGSFSCVYPYDAVLDGPQEKLVVFEGDIVAGGVSTVRISQMRSFAEEIYNPEPKAGKAWIEDDTGISYYDQTLVSGDSFSIPMENAPHNRRYRMKAEVDGETYVSDWLDILDPPLIENINIAQTSDRANVQVSVTMRGGSDATGYIALSYEETWEFHTDFIGYYDLDTSRWTVSKRGSPYPNYWCWKTATSKDMILVDYTEMPGTKISNYPLLRFPRSDSRNHKRYSINVKATTLSKETYNYLKNLKEISENNGSLFSPNPGDMASNVSCESDPGHRALGFVKASCSVSSRKFDNSIRFYTYVEPSTASLYLPDSPANYREDYENGFYPIDYMSLPSKDGEGDAEGIYWGPLRCIDCVAAGGTLEKPSFWQ